MIWGHPPLLLRCHLCFNTLFNMSEWDTSKTLLMRVRDQNSTDAWNQFNDTYRPFIYSLLKKFEVSHEDCEDLTQDVLLKTWKALESFLYEPARCRYRTWLARVCKNTVLNFLELKRNKNKKLDLEDSTESLLKLSVNAEIETNEETEWKLFLANKAWVNISRSFKENQLKAYSLMIAGKSAKEAAEVCELKENTVYLYRKNVQTAMSIEIQRLSNELDG